ncbi:MAG: hypothetical protein EOO44_01695 [Flavobacterium sp.]|nr:MAG: hypothetical protein EOO44_01695 [Flavobacterium sp.]
MKNVFFIVALVWSFFASGQNAILVPPENITASFDKQHPKIKPVWSMEYSNNLNEDVKFIANFFINKTKVLEVYDSAGNLKANKAAILLNKLPLTARNYLKQNYPSKSYSSIKLVTDDKNSSSYEVEAKKEGKIYYVNFDKDGNYIGRTRIG